MRLTMCDPQKPVRRGSWGAVTRSHSHTPPQREKKRGGRRVETGLTQSDISTSRHLLWDRVSDVGVTDVTA